MIHKLTVVFLLTVVVRQFTQAASTNTTNETTSTTTTNATITEEQWNKIVNDELKILDRILIDGQITKDDIASGLVNVDVALAKKG
jgi:hypothetical protein